MALSDTKLRTIHGRAYAGPAELSDGDGLSARITKNGTISFQVRYQQSGKTQRYRLGRYPDLSLKDARIKAAEFKEQQRLGVTHQAQEPTAIDVIESWMTLYVKRQLKPKTIALYEHITSKYASQFPAGPVGEIGMDEWLTFFDGLSEKTPGVAYRVMSMLKAALSWAVRRQMISTPDVMQLRPSDVGAKSKQGTRVLSLAEVAGIWRAIEQSRASSANKLIHQFCLIYGCRLSEIRLAKREDIDFEAMLWTVPPEHSKTNKPIERPIIAQTKLMFERALMASDSDWLFPGVAGNAITIAGCNRYLRRLRVKLGYPYWRIHDSRRTLSTRLSEAGVAPHVTERMLGHELRGVMAIYNKHNWIAEQRDGYELWWQIISDALAC